MIVTVAVVRNFIVLLPSLRYRFDEVSRELTCYWARGGLKNGGDAERKFNQASEPKEYSPLDL
jgi:hypothetical protein